MKADGDFIDLDVLSLRLDRSIVPAPDAPAHSSASASSVLCLLYPIGCNYLVCCKITGHRLRDQPRSRAGSQQGPGQEQEQGLVKRELRIQTSLTCLPTRCGESWPRYERGGMGTSLPKMRILPSSSEVGLGHMPTGGLQQIVAEPKAKPALQHAFVHCTACTKPPPFLLHFTASTWLTSLPCAGFTGCSSG